MCPADNEFGNNLDYKETWCVMCLQLCHRMAIEIIANAEISSSNTIG